MAAEIKTIRRVYLRPGIADKSMHHSAFAPDPAKPGAQPGADQAILKLVFIGGIAENVPEATYDIFAALGVATKERPRRQWEQEEDV